MLSFNDLFPEVKNNETDYKIHLATVSGTDPLDEFIRDKFKEWQERQSKRNFERKYLISFISFGTDEWLYAGIYKKLNCEFRNNFYFYDTELLDINTDLIGRLIIKFRKSFRQSYPYLENCINNFQISQILKEKYSIEEFPGYENILIDFSKLQTIIQKNYPSWYTALKNIKGVYLITDKSNGKHYVGSAYGEYAFWSRWANYSENGHGGDIELKNIIRQNGFDYAKNFQFSILEICSAKTDNSVIISREQFWKRVLITRDFGFNKN
jgi:hypothetical protein